MLTEAIMDLIKAIVADDKKAKEKAYRFLERVGMDRHTARIVAIELIKEKKITKEDLNRE